MSWDANEHLVESFGRKTEIFKNDADAPRWNRFVTTKLLALLAELGGSAYEVTVDRVPALLVVGATSEPLTVITAANDYSNSLHIVNVNDLLAELAF